MLAVAVNDIGWGESRFGSERFDPGCIRLIREAAETLGSRHGVKIIAVGAIREM